MGGPGSGKVKYPPRYYRAGEPWKTIPLKQLRTYFFQNHVDNNSVRTDDLSYPIKSYCPECDKFKPVFYLHHSPGSNLKDYDELLCGDCLVLQKTGQKWLLPFRLISRYHSPSRIWVVEHRRTGIYLTKPTTTSPSGVKAFNKVLGFYLKDRKYLDKLLDKAIKDMYTVAETKAREE